MNITPRHIVIVFFLFVSGCATAGPVEGGTVNCEPTDGSAEPLYSPCDSDDRCFDLPIACEASLYCNAGVCTCGYQKPDQVTGPCVNQPDGVQCSAFPVKLCSKGKCGG